MPVVWMDASMRRRAYVMCRRRVCCSTSPRRCVSAEVQLDIEDEISASAPIVSNMGQSVHADMLLSTSWTRRRGKNDEGRKIETTPHFLRPLTFVVVFHMTVCVYVVYRYRYERCVCIHDACLYIETSVFMYVCNVCMFLGCMYVCMHGICNVCVIYQWYLYIMIHTICTYVLICICALAHQF